jgi:UDP-N-acetyl-2-amino-2-deoxyglucuronate dehydrogenase
MKNFALIGVAGYIAPRHLQAIRDTNNNLVAALDRSDTVGVMDSFFPMADFFTEFERFDRHLDKLRRQQCGVDYVSICSPNYLHDSHIRFSLKQGADAICEKPLVLNPWNVDALSELERETGKRVYTILQLRLHPAIIALREKVRASPPNEIFDVNLTYITSRGRWYYISWKGDISKSGGIATNIGIHFFDMLIWVFGAVKNLEVKKLDADSAEGFLELERARVKWMLSINFEHIPQEIKAKGKRTYRSLNMGGEEIEFSDGFTDLHTESYREILKGLGFGLADTRPAIELAYQIRNAKKGN